MFNNVNIDAAFGMTSKILLDEITPDGAPVFTLEVPNSTQSHLKRDSDQLVTSFSSKSELAINLSTDRRFLTFMGYPAPVAAIDVSNSSTPRVIDPTNADSQVFNRVVAKVDQSGHFTFTKTNAFSGDNGRGAILNAEANVAYMAGNAGDGQQDPQQPGVIIGGGVQILPLVNKPLSAQDPGDPSPVGSFNVTELGLDADKVGKDTNFRGVKIFNDVVYLTKGSGSNGIDTVYFIDTSGSTNPADPTASPRACPNGTGLPAPGAKLPTAPLPFTAGTLQIVGVTPYNMCILNGFNTEGTDDSNVFPFGIWFANATTAYVSDEGDGKFSNKNGADPYAHVAGQTQAGLQKWVLSDGVWKQVYVLTNGLGLGVPYTVAGYPTGTNPLNKNLPWAPTTDGLRNLTGRLNRDGTVTIWAVTSVASGSGDNGADPNMLVAITDTLDATTLPADEAFKTVLPATFGQLYRGVAFAPGTTDAAAAPAGSGNGNGNGNKGNGNDKGNGNGKAKGH